MAHIGIAAFVATFFYLPAIFAVAGALLPDIIDKSLFMLGVTPCGRFIGHSIFFAPVIGLITYLVTRRKSLAIAITLGSLLHLVLDLGYFIPLLYPIKNYPFSSICGPIEITSNILEWVAEGIGIVLIMITFSFNSKFLYLRDKLWSKIFKGRIKRVPYGKNKRTAHPLQNKRGRNKGKVRRI